MKCHATRSRSVDALTARRRSCSASHNTLPPRPAHVPTFCSPGRAGSDWEAETPRSGLFPHPPLVMLPPSFSSSYFQTHAHPLPLVHLLFLFLLASYLMSTPHNAIHRTTTITLTVIGKLDHNSHHYPHKPLHFSTTPLRHRSGFYCRGETYTIITTATFANQLLNFAAADSTLMRSASF